MNRAVRALSVFVVLLCWLGASVTSLGHATESVHRYCDQHRQLEDVDAHHDEGAPKGVSLSAAVMAQDRGESDSRDGDEPDEHKACAFAKVFECKSTLQLEPPAFETRWMSLGDPSVVVTSEDVLNLYTWLLAPKNSPPQRA